MRSFTKLYEVRRMLLLEKEIKTQMLIISFWTFFKYLGNCRQLEKTKTPKMFVDAGVSF